MTPFAASLVAIAKTQFTLYSKHVETDNVLAPQIKKYWQDLGLDFPGVSTAWSAVFISWCVKQAGATKAEFAFAAAHSVFVHQAIVNLKNSKGVFRGYEFNAIQPNVGDILQNNRAGHKYDYAFAGKEIYYLSHSAIVIEKGTDATGQYIVTVGGNESQSIRTKKIYLDASGKIPKRDKSPFICLIQNTKA
jgi:hypothetical protein